MSSITSEDLSLLSKEELIARLMESDKRLQESAKREAAKDAQINELRTKYILHTTVHQTCFAFCFVHKFNPPVNC